MQNLNRLAAECHAANQHWWHDPATGERLNRNVGEMFMLMVSEVAEGMEGERKNRMDDHLPHRKMIEVELADVAIRILDYAGARNVDLDRGVTDALLPDMPANKGEALLQIVAELVKAPAAWVSWLHDEHLCRALALVIRYAEIYGYDLDGALAEKRAYNAQRADHKPEARLAPGGKKW